MGEKYESWGRYPPISQKGINLHNNSDLLPDPVSSMLAYGNGRSYGDSCLNDKGIVLGTKKLDRFISFDREIGLLKCQSGVLLEDILKLIVPRGWFLPVTPGTKLVTLGGALANDVHGKNHHVAGTLGCHVKSFQLLRSDGQMLLCSPHENTDYFESTIGGLGLTGLILWVEISLKKISSSFVKMENIKFGHINDFFDIASESDKKFEYTVAWLDCTAKGKNLGRGHFTRGNHIGGNELEASSSFRLNVPLTPPMSLVNSMSVPIFNTLYFHKQLQHSKSTVSHYDPSFYPLDGILNWNRIYGPKGFLQYQCVIPLNQSHVTITEILRIISNSGIGSFLVVIKVCGDIKSPGMMSFPIAGTSLALDFPNIEGKTLPLFDTLDKIVAEAGGRIYPAKDAHMSAKNFQKFYSNWRDFEKFKDPNFSSNFWRRVTES